MIYLNRAGLYCIQHAFSAKDTANLLALQKDHRLLREAWLAFEDDDEAFCNAVTSITENPCTMCDACDEPTWREEMYWVPGRQEIWCESCCDDRLTCCDNCEDLVEETRNVDGDDWCESCWDHNACWCDTCEVYYNPENGNHEHDEQCDCEAPVRHFRFPADGHGTIAQDERLTVELPKGTIDEQGMRRIRGVLCQEFGFTGAADTVDEVGPTWQTKRGNFTRRLSSALHKRGLKLRSELVSEIGNLARQHSSEEAAWEIEVTRNLNLEAGAFYHEESCWWQSYGNSRCCLKNWGGIGLRSFNSPYGVSGRAWILPLKNDEDENLLPTHDALTADAYVVFNGYGDLSGYTPARIVAHLTGKTYRSIDFDADGMFVNGDHGYLIASEAICQNVSAVSIDQESHSQGDAHQVRSAA